MLAQKHSVQLKAVAAAAAAAAAGRQQSSSLSTKVKSPAEKQLPAEALHFVTASEIAQYVREDETQIKPIVMVGIGAKWLFSCRATLHHTQTMGKDPAVQQDCKIFLLDGDTDRTFCHSNRIIVGQCAIVAWYRGRRVQFEHAPDSGWPATPVQVLFGPFAPHHLKQILQSIRSVLREIDSSAAKIVVPLSF